MIWNKNLSISTSVILRSFLFMTFSLSSEFAWIKKSELCSDTTVHWRLTFIWRITRYSVLMYTSILFAYWILHVINLSNVRNFQICTNWGWISHRWRMTWEVSKSADYFLFISSVTRRSDESLQIWCKSVCSLWLWLSVLAQDERLHPQISSRIFDAARNEDSYDVRWSSRQNHLSMIIIYCIWSDSFHWSGTRLMDIRRSYIDISKFIRDPIQYITESEW